MWTFLGKPWKWMVNRMEMVWSCSLLCALILQWLKLELEWKGASRIAVLLSMRGYEWEILNLLFLWLVCYSLAETFDGRGREWFSVMTQTLWGMTGTSLLELKRVMNSKTRLYLRILFSSRKVFTSPAYLSDKEFFSSILVHLWKV